MPAISGNSRNLCIYSRTYYMTITYVPSGRDCIVLP